MADKQRGIKITMKNGKAEWIDPVVHVQIYNGYCNYLYALKDLENVEKLELYDVEEPNGR